MTDLFQDFPIYQGSDVTITDTIYEADGFTRKNITGWALEATFAPLDTMTIDDDLTKTIGDGVTITDGVNGVCEIVLLAADTADMRSVDWEWALWRIDAGFKHPLSLGTITVAETARSRSS